MRLITVAAVLIAMMAPGVAAEAGCRDFGGWCAKAGSVDDDSAIEIQAETGDSGAADGSTDSGNSGDDSPADPRADLCTDVICREELYTVQSLPDVTASDLARFVPHTPELVTEPDGVALKGAPANLIATASTHTLQGRLFDYDVTVRFTPARFVFDHGDGESTETESGGTSWESLGQAQLTPTSTSHVFTERGRYTASVTVLYTADVDFGTGRWRPVTGLVRATGGEQQIRVVEAHTALVQHTCLEDPDALGC